MDILTQPPHYGPSPHFVHAKILFFVIIKCADGPADVLDFDDEDIGALSKHNRIMYTHHCG